MKADTARILLGAGWFALAVLGLVWTMRAYVEWEDRRAGFANYIVSYDSLRAFHAVCVPRPDGMGSMLQLWPQVITRGTP